MYDKKRPLVKIRVNADSHVVEDVATKIGEQLETAGYEIIEQSPMYTNRHPYENEGRVYLTVR